MEQRYAAQRTWFAIDPDGNAHELKLKVGVPEPNEQFGSWTARVELHPIDSNAHEIHGGDAWQATTLSIDFVASRLRHASSKGWRFYWERGGDVADPQDLLSFGIDE